ncbi:MAG TPA: pitrilysin family protein [Polyangiaceae bacterium]|jgi:predicted Zn-dependent peptidase|nr:MAG: Protease 3 precursor [Deltaproteobacteria bacterium ADurb.Bin207]HNS95990.1 pitrilysin family protein [Polyangiaceae bacterium]HNZ22669.1 pitrilysin family protein [Polyangiaceae bacterium]HOD21563.1 pitrilysin family protein [Polyangiaceae bacterium]HOE49287.1 pitrilysin family protein [Polyangiaceae bacterium]
MQLSNLKVHRTTLDRGLRLVCVEQPLLHGICVSLHVPAGPRFEQTSNNGCSHMLEHMLFRGTPEHPSAHALAVAIERLGGTLYGATYTDHGHMSVTLPSETFERGLELFAHVVTQPVFADMDVERGIIREEILEGLDEDGQCIEPDNLTRAVMFPSHPLGMPITGTLATLDTLGETVLRQHHARLYTANHAVLCIAGPIEAKRCEQLVAAAFQRMPAGQPLALQPPTAPNGPRFLYTESQGSQTDLRLAFRAPGRNDPSEPAAELLVRLLDDGMSTRLYARICDEMGLCYDVSAEYEPFEDTGVLDLAATVRHERAPLVMRELCGIVAQLADQGPSEEEMRVAKNRAHWGLESLLDHAEGLADYHGLSELHGLERTLIERRDKVERVRRDEVVEVARRVFSPGQGAAVAVGMLKKTQRKEIEMALASLRNG